MSLLHRVIRRLYAAAHAVADAVKWVIKGPVTIHADILGLLDRFSHLEDLIMGLKETLDAFAARVDAATTEIAADLAALLARVPDLTDEEKAAWDARIAKLEALGRDTNP